MLRMISKISFVLVAVFLFTNTAFATNIGVFSLMEITQNSDIAKAAERELNAAYGKENDALKKETAAFQQKVADYQKKAAALSDKSRAEQEQALQKTAMSLQERENALAQKVAPRQQAMQKNLATLLQKACENYAKAKKLDVILEMASAPYVASSANITSGILAEINKLWKSQGSKFK